MTKKIVGRLAAAVMAGLIAVTSCGFANIASAAANDEPVKYTVSLEQTDGGRLSFMDSEESRLQLVSGSELTIMAVPNEDFETESVKATDGNGQEIGLVQGDSGYQLVMPESDVTVSAVFKAVQKEEADAEDLILETAEEVSEESVSEDQEEALPIEEAEEAGMDSENEQEDVVPVEETGSAVEDQPVEQTEEADGTAEEQPVEQAEDTEATSEQKTEDTSETEGNKEAAAEEKEVALEWIQLSSEEVDAMVGMSSARKRVMLRASATTIYEGAMNRFYGAATPHLYDSNGNLVYCILPWSASPNGVNVSFNDYNITSASDGNLQLMAKLMYYGYGGGGNILGGYSAADQEAITHFALSYVWMIYMGNTHGYGDWTSSGGSSMDGTGQAIVLNFLSQVQGMPAVTGTLHIAGLYEASGQVYQDLAYGNFTPEVRNGKLTLSKSSAIPKISNDNACYSLEGAVYGVYSDSGCTSGVGQFTTNENGKATAALELKEGTYYVKEITPSKGYLLDPTVYTCKVTADTTTEAKVTEVPGNDPVTVILLKRDSETGTAQRGLKLSGAEYSVKYYDVNSETDPAADGKTPVKTWVFKTDEKGQVLLDDAHLVSGDAFYYSDDKPVFPLGTITIQETKAPKGYVKDSKVYVANTVRKTQTSVVTSNLPNSETRNSKEDIIRGDLKFYKIDAATRKSMSGIPFKITAQSTGESHVMVSDKNGLVSTAASDVPHTQNTNKGRSSDDGIWFGSGDPDNSKGALYYDAYTVEEQPCAANYGKDLVSFEVTIEKNHQTVEYGSVNNLTILIHTTARDGATDTKTVAAEKNATVIDTVAYENLTVGRTYVLKGRFMDQSTGKELKVGGKTITAEKSFTPKSAKGTVKMTFTLDASGLEGKTLVVFEDLYWNGNKIADHEDIEDDDQAVFVPSVKTTATDSETKDHTGTAAEKATITDKVVYTGLTPGKTYHLKGVVMDKETGEPLVQDGKEITAEMDFAPGKPNGSVTLKVSFDASLLAGKTIVMFETVTYQGRNVAMHTDLTDEDQTIHYPEIHTSAVDKDTKDNVGTVSEKAVIVDTVSYSNLIVGKEYTVKGTLMDQKTGNELLINGKAVTAEKTFKPEKAEGTVEMEFTLDASALQGTSVVVFEDLYHKDVKVTAHADITDEGQTIHYPEIKTSAADSRTKDDQGIAAKKVTIVDTVSYTNLIIGKEYTVKGTLMDQESGKKLLVNGKAVTAEKTFTAQKTAGTIALEFTLNSEAVKGKTTVVFEELYHSDVKVTVHADITDKDQTVHIPEIHTNAVDGSTMTHVGEVTGKAVIVDTVSYHNLIAGREYTVKGVLMNKETGEALEINGAGVTAETTFKAEKPDGTVELIYELDASALQGQTVVVFEDLYYKGIQICTHADIEDEDQTVHYPEIHTTAKDSVTGDEQAVVSEETTIIDTVAYHNLIPGETYVLKGSLMDKSTKKVLSIDGAELTAEKSFVPEEADGQTDLTFTFPAESLQGTTTVVFEKLYNAEINVVSHEDFEDEGQTVYIPSVKTSAKDRDTQSRSGSVKKSAVVEDIVNYTNLIIGREYTVKGVLMNKETGEEILQDGKKITAEKTFTAEQSAGTVTLTFAVDSTLLEGKSVVVFEDLYREDILLVSHADIEDEDQTVHYPKIRTSASIGGSKTVTADSFVTLTDVVTFENLIPGETYSLQGILMNAETGSEFSVSGNSVRETVTFIPEKADGTAEVVFRFDAEGLGGSSTVVFEKLFHNGKEIAKHEDLKDKDQTVSFMTPPVPPKNPPKTGDANDMVLPVAAMIAAGAVLFWLLIRRRRMKGSR